MATSKRGLGKSRSLGKNPGKGAAGAAPAAGAGKGKKPKFNPWKVLEGLETGSVLSPKQMRAAANALTVLETRPEIHGYKEIATQLGKQRDAASAGLAALGTRTSGQVSDVYTNIAAQAQQQLATQQALAQRLGQEAAAINAQGAQGLEATQEGAVGALNANIAARGGAGGGSAQQALSDAVAAQRAQQAQEGQAAQQFALSQGAATTGLLAGMAGATQARGGEAIGQIGRDIASRTADSNMKFNENIQTAMGKLAEAKASRGAKKVKNLLELRGAEQKHELGKAAVASEKQKLQLEQQENAEDREQQDFENALSLEKLGLERWKAHHPNASNDEVREKKEDLRQERREVKALIPGLVSAYGAPKTSKQLNQFINAVNGKASADPAIVQKVVKHWWEERLKKLSNDPNGASLGR